MFVGALYPALPNDRSVSPHHANSQSQKKHNPNNNNNNNNSSSSSSSSLTAHRTAARGPCVGVVDCRATHSGQTGKAPMALRPVAAESQPGARFALSAPVKAPHAGPRARSVVSAAATAALQHRPRRAQSDDDEEEGWGTADGHGASNEKQYGVCLPRLDEGRMRSATVDWTRRELDMEEAETRQQIAALPDSESEDEDDEDDAMDYARQAVTDDEGSLQGVSPLTAAAHNLVSNVLPHSTGTPTPVALARAQAPVPGAVESVSSREGHGRAHPLWRFQASLMRTRRTPLYTAVFAPYCRLHTRMQLVLSKADYFWDVMLAEEGLRGSLLQSAWEERARDVHPLVWVMSTRSTGMPPALATNVAGDTSARKAAPTTTTTTTTATTTGVSKVGFLPRLGESSPKWRTGDGARSLSTLLPSAPPHHGTSLSSSSPSPATLGHSQNSYDEVTSGHFTMDSVCLRLLSDHMAHAKPSIPALLDNAFALLSQPPLKPLYPPELGRILHVLAHELVRQMGVMEAALQRLDDFARAKEKHGQARGWMLTLLRLCRETAETTSEADLDAEAAVMSGLEGPRTRFFSHTGVVREPWAPTSLALQEPSVDDVQAWYELVEALHTTGVASLKPAHVLDGLAAALAPFAAPALLTVNTPSLVYGEPRARPSASRAARSTRPSQRSTGTRPTTSKRATVVCPSAVEASRQAPAPSAALGPAVKEVDLALALFSLHALGADASVFAQRDVTYSLQEVTTMIQCACLLCESRREEDDTYLASTVRFAAPPSATAHARHASRDDPTSAGTFSRMREEVDALLTQLWDIGVYEVSSHFLRQMMRERAPLFQDSLRRVHQTYTTGKPPRPELEVALAASFLKGCYSVLPSPSAGAGASAGGQGGEPGRTKNGAAAAPEALEYGAAQRVRQEVGRRLRNAYICSNVQRRFSSSFYLIAVCHEAVAQLRELAVMVLWELFAVPAHFDHAQHRGGTGGGRTGSGARGLTTEQNFFLLSSTSTAATSPAAASSPRPPHGHSAAFAPALRRASAALTPGYHLNDRINPLLLPNTPPPEETLRWLERRVQQRKAPRTALAALEPADGDAGVPRRHLSGSLSPSHLPSAPAHTDQAQRLRVDAPMLVSSPALQRRGPLPAHAPPAATTAVAELYDNGLVMDIFKVANRYRQLHDAPEAL